VALVTHNLREWDLSKLATLFKIENTISGHIILYTNNSPQTSLGAHSVFLSALLAESKHEETFSAKSTQN
jgi:hypothetical protein